MTPEEARLILHCRRPHGQDDADPAIASAIAALQTDHAASAEHHASQSLDSALCEQLRRLPVPDALRGNILAGRRLTPRAARFRPLWIAAAAAAVLAIAGPALWKFLPWNQGQPVFASASLSDFRLAAADKLTKHDFRLDRMKSLDELKDRLKDKTPAAAENLCGGCQGGVLGCHIYDWQGRDVTLICFNAGDKGTVHLFTVDASALRGAPAGKVFETRDGWNTLAWACPSSGRIMLLAGEEARTTSASLSSLIAAGH
jgi:hypothetical protein